MTTTTDINDDILTDAAGALADKDTRLTYPATDLLKKQVNVIARRHVGGDLHELALARYEEDYYLIHDRGVDQIDQRHTEKLRAAVFHLLHDVDTGERVDEDVTIVDAEGWERLQKDLA